MPIRIGLAKKGLRPPPWIARGPSVDLPIGNLRYPTLRLIDPFADTRVSSYQFRALLPDFERLAADSPGPDMQAALDLVRRCAADEGTTLWFVGD